MTQYKDMYVAFIDLLGFSWMIGENKYTCNELNELFTSMWEDEVILPFWIEKEGKVPTNEVKKYIMSDSVVLYIEARKRNSLEAILICAAHLAHSLLIHDEPILVRGGIARGDFYRKEWRAFGKALVLAHNIEQSVKLPRIVIDSSIDVSNEKYKRLLYSDELLDEKTQYRCVNYFSKLLPGQKEKVKNYSEKFLIDIKKNKDMDTGKKEAIKDKYDYILINI